MFSTFLKEINGYFDRRFFLSAFFPVLAFWILSLGMGFMLWGTQTLLEFWQKQPAELKTVITIGSLGILLFIAYFFHIFQTNLTRLYEGYWDNIPILSWWGKFRRQFYQHQWDFLQNETFLLVEEITALESDIPKTESSLQTWERHQKLDELHNKLSVLEREWFLFLPPIRAQVMPTQLGNILRTSEIYPFQRYKIDAVVMWSRLQSILPKDFIKNLRDAKANLDLFLVVTTLAGLFSIGWGIGIGIFTNRWDLFIFASVGWIVALLSYSGVLQAARSYSELIKSSFDLYRWELLKAFHLKMPESYEGERRIWDQVNSLIYRNYPPTPKIFHFETKPEKSSSSQQSSFINKKL